MTNFPSVRARVQGVGAPAGAAQVTLRDFAITPASATAPITTHPGDWVEINHFDEGLQIHPMHRHGLSQLMIGEDGYPLSAPYTVDTLAPSRPTGSTITTQWHRTRSCQVLR